MSLPTDAAQRKATPIATGFCDYFPDAMVAVAQLSKIGNDQHNPGQPLHWAKEKSTDHADCILRHLIERGTIDADGVRHSAKVAWRAMALLQIELEAAAKPVELPNLYSRFGFVVGEEVVLSGARPTPSNVGKVTAFLEEGVCVSWRSREGWSASTAHKPHALQKFHE